MALEKGLAPLANSDIHDPSNLAWHVHEGDHRPVTLVFATERTEAGVREALFAKRTVAWSGEMLAGREELLRPLVAAALTIENPRLAIQAGGDGYVRIRNVSDLRLELAGPGSADGVTAPEELVIAADGTSLLEIRVPKAAEAGTRRVTLEYTIRNALVAPGEGLTFPIALEIEVGKLPAAP